MSNLGDTLAASGNVQGAGATILQIWGAAVNAIADAAGIGVGITVIAAIIGILDPPAGSSPQPSLQDLLNKLNEFSAFVASELDQIDKRDAGGQVRTWANELQTELEGPEGPLPAIRLITDWQKYPGLPLPDNWNPSPSNCHIYASAALGLLIGDLSQLPPNRPPTSYWYLPPGDLPLFQPDYPWTYLGTGHMFNQTWEYPLEAGGPIWDNNPYTFTGAIGQQPPIPQFDLSALNFTNDYSPTVSTGVPPNIAFNPPVGVPPNNAFNPTWILQQSMAAVAYYFLLCGAVLKNFPSDGSTVNDFVGNGPLDPNFLGGLSWYHDQIRAGIVCIAPPFPWDLLPIGPNDLIPASANGGISTWSVPCGLSANANSNPFEPSQGFYSLIGSDPAASAPPSLWSRPFGALCNYNGFVAGYGRPQPSVDNYPDYVYPTPGQSVRLPVQIGPAGAVLPPPPTAAPHEWYTGFYCKYLVACLWRAKLVYNGMGLGDMWRTINKLYVMFGQPPRLGPCFGDWSLREVFRMLGSADEATFPLPYQQVTTPGIIPGTTAPLSTKFTVRAFLQFMNSAAPTPGTPLHSLRAALQA